jgi:hypothetical protein
VAADSTAVVAYGAVLNPDGSTDMAAVVVRAEGEIVPGSYAIDLTDLLAQALFLDDVQDFVLPGFQDPEALFAWFQELEAAHKFVGVSGTIVVDAVGPAVFSGTFSGTLTDLDGLLLVSVSGGTFAVSGSGEPVAAPGSASAVPRPSLTAHPNPFNPRTTVALEWPADATARVTVHDLAGRRVRTLYVGELTVGQHVWSWDGRDGAGRRLAAGVYLVRAAGGAGVVAHAKVVLAP